MCLLYVAYMQSLVLFGTLSCLLALLPKLRYASGMICLQYSNHDLQKVIGRSRCVCIGIDPYAVSMLVIINNSIGDIETSVMYHIS